MFCCGPYDKKDVNVYFNTLLTPTHLLGYYPEFSVYNYSQIYDKNLHCIYKKQVVDTFRYTPSLNAFSLNTFKYDPG